jgi:hypothetical protein
MFLNLLLKNKLMQKFQNVFIVFGFKITWLSCILGELYINSWIGFFVGLIFLSLFFFYQTYRINFLYKILLLSLIGYLFDSFLSFFGLYTINAKTDFLFLPLWFVVLWPSFSCLLLSCFVFLKKQKLLPIFLGGIFGPLSYYTGVSSGLANVSSYKVFILISFFWSLIILFYANYILTKKLL